jgi:hypothetical protein
MVQPGRSSNAIGRVWWDWIIRYRFGRLQHLTAFLEIDLLYQGPVQDSLGVLPRVKTVSVPFPTVATLPYSYQA